jgi:integrase
MQKTKKPFESYTLKALSDTEYKKVLAACGTLEDELLMRLAVENGFRRIDISKIEVKNVDLENSKLLYYEHKKKTFRTVPISAGVVQLFRKYFDTLPKRTKYVFSWGKSEFGDFTAWRRFQKLCDTAGIERRPFHALRGTCIKFHQKRGWNLNEVSKLIGDDPATVQLHYATTSDSEIAEKMKELE